MAPKEHHYQVTVKWTGNKGNGTQTYKSYDRSYEMSSTNKPTILGSSDPAFLGDNSRWNPEDLLLASASACHKLWYLHLCAVDGISVLSYIDAKAMPIATAFLKSQRQNHNNHPLS